MTNKITVQKRKRAPPFDPKIFLHTDSIDRAATKYKKDKIIFSQGAPSDAIFYIQKGRVKISVVSKQGKEAVSAILGADEFCGEGCLTGQKVRLASAVTMSECDIMRVERTAMIRVLHEQP